MSAPLRQIVCSCNSHRRTRRGVLHTATLECGHLNTVNAAERRRGKVHCFDCFYDKPKHPQALITLEEKGYSVIGNKEPELDDKTRGWMRAMGMRGYVGSPAEAEDRLERRARKG